MKKNFRALAVLLVMMAMFLGCAQAEKGEYTKSYRLINKDNPGQRLDIKSHLVKGKLNIIDFYSDYCPPCRAVAPKLKQLTMKDKSVVVSKIDINRQGRRGIDWSSPVVQQYKINSVPHFKVYDEKGRLVAEGRKATDIVLKRLQAAGVR